MNTLFTIWHNQIGILPEIQRFMDFCCVFFKDLSTSKTALTRSILELEKCSFFLNGSEFRQKLIGNVVSELRRQN